MNYTSFKNPKEIDQQLQKDISQHILQIKKEKYKHYITNRISEFNKVISSENAPLVSVVIPVFNVSAYISQCLESIIYQSYHNIEIIIVDDGSTDGGERICDQFAILDSRIHVVHTANHGLSSARNLGIEMANGRYIIFVDGDDWIELNSIDRFVNYALYYDADIVIGRRSKEYKNAVIEDKLLFEKPLLIRGENIFGAYSDGLFGDAIWNKIYSNRCFKGLRFYEGHNYEDTFLMWRLLKMAAEENMSIVVLPDLLYHFRIRKSSITHTLTLLNLLDHWNAHYEKYEALSHYAERNLTECINSICRIGTVYYSLSKEEKTIAKRTIIEMQSFLKRQTRYIKMPDYSTIKKIFLVSFQSFPFFTLKVLSLIIVIKHWFTVDKKVLYD